MPDNKKDTNKREKGNGNLRHSVAPYNFVSLPDKAKVEFNSFEKLPAHNDFEHNRKIEEELVSGYINYTIRNNTPLMIGNGNCDNKDKDGITEIEPFQDKENFIIPGNTMRGVVRTNVGILSMSNMADDIEDESYYFRSFGKGNVRRDYAKRLDIRPKPINKETVSAPHNINGGFIYLESKDKYVLLPVKKEKNYSYYSIQEQYLRKMNLKNIDIQYMYKEDISELIANKSKYSLTKDEKGNKGIQTTKNKLKKDFLKSIKNTDYRPYCTRISYDLTGDRTISKIYKPGLPKKQGYILSSQHIPGKLTHYIIPSDRFDEENAIYFEGNKKEFIEFYNNDLLRTKKYKLTETGEISPEKSEYEYYALPNEIGKEHGKPIFWGEFNNNIYLGFTPYLRIPYDYSIKHGIEDNYKNAQGISFMEALFGFTKKEINSKQMDYKSRLSFEDCICNKRDIQLSISKPIILEQPHPTAYSLYLEQDNEAKEKQIVNYNDEKFKIRGIKQYWIRNDISIIDEQINSVKSVKVKSSLKAIPEHTIFNGKIYFKNLLRKELGLLLWALKVDKNARENIGMGKPYGFGHIEIDNIDTYVENKEKKYSSMGTDYYEKVSTSELRECYNKGVDSKSIRELIKLKTTVINESKNYETAYMKLGDPRFINLYPLLSVDKQIEIINGHKSGYKNIRQENQSVPKKKDKLKRVYEDKKSKSSNKDFLNNEAFDVLGTLKFD